MTILMRTVMRSGVVVFTSLALLVGGGGVAEAAVSHTHDMGNNSVRIEGDAADDTFDVFCDGTLKYQGGSGDTGATCADVAFLDVSGLDGVDSIDLTGVDASTFPLLPDVQVWERTFFPGDNDDSADTVQGSQIRDVIRMGFQDTVHGNGGNDLIEGAMDAYGGAGDDVLRDVGDTADGGPGDDVVYGLGNGPLIGGSGHDRVVIDLIDLAVPDDIALDLDLTAAALVVSVPGVGAQAIGVSGFEDARIGLLDSGTQTFSAAEFPGPVVVDGNGGRDIITGSSHSDLLRGGPGNDLIHARDGVADLVFCGKGTDTAEVDAFDVVNGCETVKLPPAGATSKMKGKAKKYVKLGAAITCDTAVLKGKWKKKAKKVKKAIFKAVTAGGTTKLKKFKAKKIKPRKKFKLKELPATTTKVTVKLKLKNGKKAKGKRSYNACA